MARAASPSFRTIQHIKILANEMLATRLGRWLGLPMPPVEVIDVSEWLVNYPLTE
jgi:hypothetical protein